MAEKKYDVIHIGEVNQDFTVPEVPEEFFTGNGDTYTCGIITDSVGGDAGNQSICVANLGDHNAFFGRLDCSFTGDRLAAILKAQGVDTSLIVRSEDCRTPKIIVNVRKDGSHRFLCGKGGGYGLRKEDIVPGTLDQTRVLAIGSLFVLDTLEGEGLEYALKTCRDAGGIVVADMTYDIRGLGPRFYDDYYRYIDYLVPSWDEASYVTGEEYEDRMADFFLDKGAGNVIIKMGSRGSYFKNRNKNFYADPFEVNPVDTTGCGDNFTAGFIHAYLKGMTDEACLQFASAAGALNSLGLGASSYIRSEEMVLEFMRKTRQRHIAH